MISHDEFREALSDTLDYLFDWEREARTDFEFAALKQWDKKDETKLDRLGRPALVFDRTRPIIQTVSGAESTNRYEPKYLPRDADLSQTNEDVPYSEAANKVYRFIRDRGDFAHHESAAFQSALICGVGCTEIYMDFEQDADGMIMMDRVPVWEIGWDPASVAPNMLDARYLIRDRFIDEDEIISRFGRELVQEVKALANTDTPGRGRGFLAALFTRETDDPRNTYFNSRMQKYYDPRKRRVRVWEMLRKDRTYQTRIFIPQILGGGDQLVTRGETQEALEMLRSMKVSAQMQMMNDPMMMQAGVDPAMLDTEPIQFIEDFPVTKIFRSYHAGNTVLKEEELPMSYFPYQFVTAFEDFAEPERRYWFGLMRSMRDPQKYANKFLSHMVHMWASNPKGAIIAESDLFDNPEEGKKEWAKADGFISVDPGKLQSPKPKFINIPNHVNMRGVETLLQHSIMSISSAAGISEQYTVGNPTDLRRTAASAVQSVKESNMVTMSQPFDALRLYKRVQGRLILDFVEAYVQESQLARLLGPEESEFIPAFKEGNLAQQYEVIAEEAPASKSKQMEVFNKLMETGFITQVMDSGVAIPPSLAKAFPFPADVNGEFEQVLTDAKVTLDMQAQLTQMQMAMEMMMLQQQMMQGPPPPGTEPGMGEPTPAEGEPVVE